ncbi:hypothetical protein [Xanthomonas arboricola]|uniref:hypothetical protein n=2 Tax=Xanthomonas TaxID=338 RepID=UPI0040406E51
MSWGQERMNRSRKLRNRALEGEKETYLAGRYNEGGWKSPATISALLAVVVAAASCGITWFRTGPELEKLHSEVIALRTTERKETAEAALAEQAVHDLRDPDKKAASELDYKRAKLDYARSADELLDAAIPSLQADTSAAVGEDGMLVIPVAIKNTGSRGVWLSNLRIRLSFVPKKSPSLTYQTKRCPLGYLPPGGMIPCHLVASIKGGSEDIEQVRYTYMIDAKPYFLDSSLSFALLRENFSEEVIEKRLKRTWTYEGIYFPMGNWDPGLPKSDPVLPSQPNR